MRLVIEQFSKVQKTSKNTVPNEFTLYFAKRSDVTLLPFKNGQELLNSTENKSFMTTYKLGTELQMTIGAPRVIHGKNYDLTCMNEAQSQFDFPIMIPSPRQVAIRRGSKNLMGEK